MNTVALQKLRRDSNENLFLIKLLFCVKTCELMTWWATWFLYVTLIYSPYELNGRIIKMHLQEVGGGCEEWMELAQDRDRWRALVSMVRNLRVPKMRGIS
jgi:hypothetical protein